jgi:hypothetical protein
VFSGDNRKAADVGTKQNGQFSKLYSAIYAYVIDGKEKGFFFFFFFFFFFLFQILRGDSLSLVNIPKVVRDC